MITGRALIEHRHPYQLPITAAGGSADDISICSFKQNLFCFILLAFPTHRRTPKDPPPPHLCVLHTGDRRNIFINISKTPGTPKQIVGNTFLEHMWWYYYCLLLLYMARGECVS